MAKRSTSEFDWDDFGMALAMRYDDLVIKASDQADKSMGTYPGHMPIYPTEEDFLRVYARMCERLSQRNLVDTFRLSDAEMNQMAQTLGPQVRTMSALQPDPSDLLDYVADRGVNRNQSIILGIMLGLNGAEFLRYQAAAEKNYLQMRRNPKWETEPPLRYSDAYKVWEEEMQALTPHFREVLGWEKPQAAAAAPAADADATPASSAPDDASAKPARKKRQRKESAEAGETPPASAATESKRRGRPPGSKDKQPRAKHPRHQNTEESTTAPGEDVTLAPPVISADDVVNQRVSFPKYDGPFMERLDIAVDDCISRGEGDLIQGKTFPDSGSFVRTVLRLADSQENVSINTQRLMNWKAHGLNRNEAVVLMVAMGIQAVDRQRFLNEARLDNEARLQTDVLTPQWDVGLPVDEELLWTVRREVIADAINDQARNLPLDGTIPKPPPPEVPKVLRNFVPDSTPIQHQPAQDTVDVAAASKPEPPQEASPPPLTRSVTLPIIELPAELPQEAVQDTITPASPASEETAAPPASEPLARELAPPPPPPATDSLQNTTPPDDEVPLALATGTGAAPPAGDTTPPPAKPKPSKAEAPPEPPPAPGMGENEMRSAQLVAVQKARKAMEEMQPYDPLKTGGIARDLLVELAAASPLAQHGWRAKALSEACSDKISEQTFQVLLNGKPVTHESFAATGAVDVLVPNLVVDSALHEEVKNYLAGIPLPHMQKPGIDLLNYVTTHEGSSGDYMRMIRHHHRKDIESFAQQCGLSKHHYTNLALAKCSRLLPNSAGQKIDFVEVAADALGIDEQGPRAAFHTLVGSQRSRSKLETTQPGAPVDAPAGATSAEITQQTLNECFVDAPDKKYYVDSTAQGRERSVAMSRFFKLLAEARQIKDNGTLARAVVASMPQGEDNVSSVLQKQILQSTKGGAFDPEKEAAIPEKATKVLTPRFAVAVANYAFPDNCAPSPEAVTELRRQCTEFLSSDKHLRKAGPQKGWRTTQADEADPVDLSTHTGRLASPTHSNRFGTRNDRSGGL